MLHANVVAAPAGAEGLLLLVHGYGADEYDLAPLAPALDPAGRCLAVCPRAPIDLAPYGGAAWYERAEDGTIERGSFERSVLALDELIDVACERTGLDRARSVVIGFSQGGAMALAVGLRDTTAVRPKAVACLSGMLQTPDWLRYAWHAEDWDPAGPGLPAVYVQHGTLDPMVDIARGRRTRDTLAAHGIAATYHEYVMHHEIRPESVRDLRAWLDGVLAG